MNPDIIGCVWTGEFDLNTLRVDGEIFESGKKKLQIQKYPDTCGRGLRVRFSKKIQDWILKSEKIRKRIFRFFTKQINPRSLGSWCIKGTEESTLGVDSSAPLRHHDPKDLGLICLVKKRKIRFRILSD